MRESLFIKGYFCENSDGSNIQLMFQNDKLVTKVQVGLLVVVQWW